MHTLTHRHTQCHRPWIPGLQEVPGTFSPTVTLCSLGTISQFIPFSLCLSLSLSCSLTHSVSWPHSQARHLLSTCAFAPECSRRYPQSLPFIWDWIRTCVRRRARTSVGFLLRVSRADISQVTPPLPLPPSHWISTDFTLAMKSASVMKHRWRLRHTLQPANRLWITANTTFMGLWAGASVYVCVCACVCLCVIHIVPQQQQSSVNRLRRQPDNSSYPTHNPEGSALNQTHFLFS